MKTVILKTNAHGAPYLSGNYEFKLSDYTLVTEDEIPIKTITFGWSVEKPSNLDSSYSDEELFEILAEKLRKDFLDFCKNYKK